MAFIYFVYFKYKKVKVDETRKGERMFQSRHFPKMRDVGAGEREFGKAPDKIQGPVLASITTNLYVL